MRRAAFAIAFVLAACARQEEPVANRFDRTSAEIENLANALTAETDNQVRSVETDVQNQIDAIAANQANAVVPAPEAPSATPATQGSANATREPRRAGQPAPSARQN